MLRCHFREDKRHIWMSHLTWVALLNEWMNEWLYFFIFHYGDTFYNLISKSSLHCLCVINWQILILKTVFWFACLQNNPRPVWRIDKLYFSIKTAYDFWTSNLKVQTNRYFGLKISIVVNWHKKNLLQFI